jgi:mycofactocin precursor peptide peptidase
VISRLADQKWPDLAGRRPLVVLPLGSCEQHGPHLPLDTDHAVAEAVAGRAAALLAEDLGLLVAPGQPYGASGEHEGFPGTVSIGHRALYLLIVEVGRSVLRWADRLLVVNGHGGNMPSLAAAIATLGREGRNAAWWPCLPHSGDLHAGYAETSMMLQLRSPAVRAERAVAGPCEPIEQLLDRLIAESVRGVSESGVLGDPSGASGQQGEELLSGMAVQLASDIRAWQVSKQGRLGSRSPAPAPAQPGVRV